MPAIEISRVMKFHSGAVDDDVLEVAELSGEEAINRPYRFELILASQDKDLDLAKLVEEKAWLSIKQGITEAGNNGRASTTVKVHGVISHIEQAGKEHEWVKYRAVLQPRLWKLSLAHNSRIFQDKTIPDIIQEICDEFDVKIENKLSASYKTREYVVQYEESDLDFIHRWMEHEGIFYYFTQDDEEETLVLGDAPEAYGTLVGDTEFNYNPQQSTGAAARSGAVGQFSGDWFKAEVVNTLSCTQKQLPKEVVLNDYNWRTPADKLKTSATVSDKGIGTVYEYNNHYTDTDEGKTLAEIRAEEINCREMEFRGKSDIRGFRSGMTFKLKEPEDQSDKEKFGLKDAFYQEYLIVEVHHTAQQTVDMDVGDGSGSAYANQFLAIPKSKSFRPPSATPWPSIKGVMTAVVDGEDGGTPYAQIDDKGRYKVRFPFDLGDSSDGSASRWVRKLEMYAGPSQGMHFPLLKGSEVLITHIDGDPDRPIISGAMFNEQNTSVVHQHNNTTNQIITPIGNTLTIDDTQGAPQIVLYTQDEKNKLVFDGSSGSEKITIKCDVSNSSIRFGKGGEGTGGKEKVTDADGIFMTADGDLNLVSGANTNMHAGADFMQAVLGKAEIHVVGEKKETIDGNHTAKTLSATHDLMIGDYNVVNLAAKVSLSAGATATAQVGAEAKVAYAVSASITRGDGFSTTFGKMFKIDKSSTTELTLEGRKFVTVLDKKVTSKAGNVEIEATAGQVKIKAATKISLECGGSKIELTPAGIKIQKGGSRQTMNDSLARLKAASIEMKASGAFTAKGATAKIN